MSKLQLSIAVGNYDRIRPLVDGEVQIEGVDPVFMLQDPEEIFFRAFRHADFESPVGGLAVKCGIGFRNDGFERRHHARAIDVKKEARHSRCLCTTRAAHS